MPDREFIANNFYVGMPIYFKNKGGFSYVFVIESIKEQGAEYRVFYKYKTNLDSLEDAERDTGRWLKGSSAIPVWKKWVLNTNPGTYSTGEWHLLSYEKREPDWSI